MPALITLAEHLAEQTHGNVRVNKDGVSYKGRQVDNSLTRKIADLVRERKPIAPMLKFMDNLYSNPDERAILDLYEWLNAFNGGQFVPTDDGCFLAYKAVNLNYTDCHTGTIDNSVGQVVMMPRKDVDSNAYNECSAGLHFCSLGYLRSFSGEKIVAVKVNPRDVVAIPMGYGRRKGRTWMYEVVYEVSDKTEEAEQSEHAIMLQAVAPVVKERKDLLQRFLDLPLVKRYIRRRKMSEANIRKMPLGRLAKEYQKFYAMSTPVDRSKLFENPLLFSREAAGLTRGQVAEELDLSYKDVYNMEMALNPGQAKVDLYLESIAKLNKQGRTKGTAVGFPKATVVSYDTETDTDEVDEYGYEVYPDYEE